MKIIKDAKKHPKNYVVQKKFFSKPIKSADGKEYHICLGSYTVDGKQAGFYARISKLPRIDSYAADIPVVIERNKKWQIKKYIKYGHHIMQNGQIGWDQCHSFKKKKK